MNNSDDSSQWTDDDGEEEDEYQRALRIRMEEEIAKRVADALPETPPLEKIRRRQDAAKQKGQSAEDLNAHLDLDEDHYTKQELEQIKSEIKGRLLQLPPWQRKKKLDEDDDAVDSEQEDSRLRELAREYQMYDPRERYPVQKYMNRVDYVPIDINLVTPALPHPNLLHLINPEAEPLYTSVKYVLGSTTFENQQTPYTHKLRGSGVVYDSVKSPKKQTTEPPRNPLVAPNLLFESRFESGNLRQARRVGQFEYELVLNTDMFTKRHTQWYYFRIQNTIPGIIYKFRIINLLKKDSLYNYGMRPLFYSETDAMQNQKGWVRHGHHISYGRNVQHLICPLLNREMVYYELEWQMEFPHADDTCYLAHCYPFTYADLINDIQAMTSEKRRAKFVEFEILCKTRAGHNCPLLTISNFEKKHCNKKYVIVSARVHPGESNSSWMMKGLYDFLTSNRSEAKELRDKFIFKIIPMLNPDGVIVGNYRCSLQARDLNRNYRWPKKERFPVIWHVKQLVHEIQQNHGIFVYCDFHGHSRKSNVFMFGNSSNAANAGKITCVKDFLNERMLPFLLSQLNPSMFSFSSSKFSIRRSKESTGRVVMFRQHGIINSFTMEATFSGTSIDENGSRHYNQQDFMDAGELFARGVLEFSKVLEDEDKESQALIALSKEVAKQMLYMSAAKKLANNLQSSSLDEQASAIPYEDISESSAPSGKATSKELHTDYYSNSIKSSVSLNGAKTSTQVDQSLVTSMETLMKKITQITSTDGKSVNECYSLLEGLALPTAAVESESSDSDSESEPEMKSNNSPKRRKKKNKKSKKKKEESKKSNKASSNSTSDTRKENDGSMQGKVNKRFFKNSFSADAATMNINKLSGSYELPTFNPFKVLPTIDNRNGNTGFVGARPKIDKRHSMSMESLGPSNGKPQSGWANPYQNRSNGGIPCYSEERSLERAARRMAEIQRKVEEKMRKQHQHMQYITSMSDDYPIDFNLDLQELNSLRIQKDYVQNRFDKSIKLLTNSQLPGKASNSGNDDDLESIKDQRIERKGVIGNADSYRQWYQEGSHVMNSDSKPALLLKDANKQLHGNILVANKALSNNYANNRSMLPHARLGPIFLGLSPATEVRPKSGFKGESLKSKAEI